MLRLGDGSICLVDAEIGVSVLDTLPYRRRYTTHWNPPALKKETLALTTSADLPNALEFFPDPCNHLRSNASKHLSTSSPKSNLCTQIYTPLPSQSPLTPSHPLIPLSHSTTTAQTLPLPSKICPPQILMPKATSTRDFRPTRSILLERRRKRNGSRGQEVGE